MKGVYIILAKVVVDTEIRIGGLGPIHFKKGVYAYIGSAQNNVEKRVARHFRADKKPHWHLDYFLDGENVKAYKAYCLEGGKELECEMAKEIVLMGEAVNGFGCSDCRCKSHLFRINEDKLTPLLKGWIKL